MQDTGQDRLAALAAADASVRLKAALAAGSHPDPAQVEVLVARCAIEPDFYVRDMLTWALIRHPAALVVPRLLVQLHAAIAQARSQALHTLSKIGDPRTWSAITPALLRDADDEVARSAWRASVVLVPEDQKPALARELATQLGRGDQQMQLSLSRALAALGADAMQPPILQAQSSSDPAVRAHARAAELLLHDPDAGFELDVRAARRRYVLGREQ